MNYHECPGTFIQKENVLTLGNKIYFARKVDGFVLICKTISYYVQNSIIIIISFDAFIFQIFG